MSDPDSDDEWDDPEGVWDEADDEWNDPDGVWDDTDDESSDSDWSEDVQGAEATEPELPDWIGKALGVAALIVLLSAVLAVLGVLLPRLIGGF